MTKQQRNLLRAERQTAILISPRKSRRIIPLPAGTAYYSGELKRTSNPADPKSYDPFSVAQTYSELGEKDNAFLWMEKAYARRVPIGDVLIDPCLDNLRSHPRYADLLRRMGLPQ